jgi:hypothetical protein
MAENDLMLYSVPDKALDDLVRRQRLDRDVKDAMENMAVAHVARDDWGGYLEAYTGILDDHGTDLNELGSNETAESLTGLEEQSLFVWFTFPSREAKKVARKIRTVTISEQDAENYVDAEAETLRALRGIHAAFLKALEGLEEGQTLVMPIPS